LDDISNAAIREGAAEYLSREERESMGMMHDATRVVKPFQRDLKFEAYERQEAQKTVGGHVENPQVHQVDDLLGDLVIGDSRTGLEEPVPESSTETLHVGRSSSQRRWGPTSTPSPSSKSNVPGVERQQHAKDTTSTSIYTSPSMPQQRADPQQELLAASLFGTGTGPKASVGINLSSKTQPSVDSKDLLDLGVDEHAAPQQQTETTQGDASLLDLLGDDSELPVTSAPQNQSNEMDMFASFEADTLPVDEPAHPPARPSTQESTPDPFKGLLD
jgi:hypothetical protein